MTFDPEKFGQRMSAIVRDTVAREVDPLRAEITSLQKRLEIAEAREPVPGPPGENGHDGATGRGIASATVRTDGLLIFSLSDGDTLEAGNVLGRDGEDGAPGRDGRDPDPEMIRGMVLEAVAALPPPERGEPGQRGSSRHRRGPFAPVVGRRGRPVADRGARCALPPARRLLRRFRPRRRRS